MPLRTIRMNGTQNNRSEGICQTSIETNENGEVFYDLAVSVLVIPAISDYVPCGTRQVAELGRLSIHTWLHGSLRNLAGIPTQKMAENS